jgi:hypothetical protein
MTGPQASKWAAFVVANVGIWWAAYAVILALLAWGGSRPTTNSETTDPPQDQRIYKPKAVKQPCVLAPRSAFERMTLLTYLRRSGILPLYVYPSLFLPITVSPCSPTVQVKTCNAPSSERIEVTK